MSSETSTLNTLNKHKPQRSTKRISSRTYQRPKSRSNIAVAPGLPNINPPFRAKKTFAPVASGGIVSKHNQEELEKNEKVACELAKEIAAKELAKILTLPEQLVQVEQLRLEKNDNKRLVSGTLKNLIKSKLDDVQNGLVNMDESIASLDTIRSGHAKILERCKEVGDLIPRDHYELIQEVNIARNNLLSTKAHIESIINIPDILEETRNLMGDDINILDVHNRLRSLQRSRNKILNAARPYPRQARQLEDELSGVVDLTNDFNTKLRELTKNHYNLALNKPAVLIKVLQVINREKKRKEKETHHKTGRARAKVVLTRPHKRSDLVELSAEQIVKDNTPEPLLIVTDDGKNDEKENVSPNTEWSLDTKVVLEWIKKACVERFNALFESCKERGKCNLTKYLDTANEKLFDDLTHVFDELRPCFPEWLDIFSIYCQEYHTCINKLLKEWTNAGNLSPDETLDLAKWISSSYTAQMQRLGANKDDLYPNLNDELMPLIEEYGKNIREKMTEWALRLIEQDRTAETKLVVNELYYTTGPTNLFQFVHSRIDYAVNTTLDKIVLVTAQQSMNVLKKYQQEMTIALKKESTSWDFGYVIALINNFSKCYDYTMEVRDKLDEKFKGKMDFTGIDFEETQRGFQDLVVSSRQALITKMLDFVSEELGQLFTRPWVLGEVTSAQVIVDTLSDYFNDVNGHIMEVHYRKLAVETLQRLVTSYIHAMFTNKQSFDDLVVRKLDSDIGLLTSFATGQKIKDKQVKSALQVLVDLKELMQVKVPELKGSLESFLKYNPDFREDMATFMIDNRDNLEWGDKRTALNEVKLIYQKRSQTNLGDIPEGIFKHLELPGGFFDSLMKEKKSEKKDNK